LALFNLLLPALLLLSFVGAANAVEANYASVDTIFSKYCLDCHASKDPEGELVLESFDSLMKGGEIGPAILPGKSADSLLIKMIEGRFEKEGKRKIMPPGKRAKLTPAEIATIKTWIDAGASAPSAPLAAKELVLPKIAPKNPPRDPVNGVASMKNGTAIAVARYGKVELRCSPAAPGNFRTFDFPGNAHAVAFTHDGNRLFAAGGQPALSGEVREWTVSGTNQSRALVRSFTAHKDGIYSMALSPDDKILATGSYDQKIKLWDADTGKELKTLSGHNGCIFGLVFRPDGKILASASADRTVKLWDVASGERRETLSQPLKDVYAVAFSPDGKRLAAGGADNRIRIWEISESAAQTTNPLLHSKFGHEGTILRLAYSPDGKTLASTADDRTVKLWDAEEMHVRQVLEEQPDWPTALAFAKNSAIVVGRLDGTLKIYDFADTTQSEK
jgi:WD40 repeat protein